MNIYKVRLRLAIAGTCSLMASAFLPAAMAQPSLSWRYEFVKLDYPNAPVSFPLGINSSRRIVGVRVDAKGVNHGYLYQAGKFTDIDYPGASQIPAGGTFTGGINDRGDVVGVFTDAQGFQHGFLRTIPEDCDSAGNHGESDHEGEARCKPVYTPIDVPGAVQTKGINFELGPGLGTAAVGINNHRDIAGLYATKGLYSVGFRLTDGKFLAIDDPASSHLPGFGDRTFAINDHGVVAGAYIGQTSPTAAPFSGGFTFDGRDYTSVFVAGSDKGGFGTQANGINNRQEVVGVFTDGLGTFHGLFWAGGQPFIVDYPNKPYSECHSINSRGDITGAYLNDLTGPSYRGFVAYLKSDE